MITYAAHPTSAGMYLIYEIHTGTIVAWDVPAWRLAATVDELNSRAAVVYGKPAPARPRRSVEQRAQELFG